jgi:Spy/CpxP family protein refolding chaperone
MCFDWMPSEGGMHEPWSARGLPSANRWHVLGIFSRTGVRGVSYYISVQEIAMTRKVLIAAFILLLSVGAALAQSPQGSPSPDMGFPMGGWKPPAALMGEWWNDPEIANELRLTQQQKQQLQQVSTNLKLTLIDAGATGLKSYVRLQSLLDAEQFDRATYNQELDTAAGAISKLIKDFGQMALTVRSTLSADQWHKLEAMRAAGRLRPHRRPEAMHDGTHDRPRRDPPSSLRNPPQ